MSDIAVVFDFLKRNSFSLISAVEFLVIWMLRECKNERRLWSWIVTNGFHVPCSSVVKSSGVQDSSATFPQPNSISDLPSPKCQEKYTSLASCKLYVRPEKLGWLCKQDKIWCTMLTFRALEKFVARVHVWPTVMEIQRKHTKLQGKSNHRVWPLWLPVYNFIFTSMWGIRMKGMKHDYRVVNELSSWIYTLYNLCAL